MPHPAARLAPLSRLIAAALLALPLPRAAVGDIAETVDHGPLGGVATMTEPGRLVVTPTEGPATTVALDNIDQITFGKDLVVVRDGNLLLINNDRSQTATRKAATIRLRAGLHRFVVPYWQGQGAYHLELRVSGPGTPGEVEVGGEHLQCFRNQNDESEPSLGIDADGYRLPELTLDQANDRRRFLTRARYRFYTGNDSNDFRSVAVLSGLELKRSGTTSNINLAMLNEQNANVGLVFEGFFKAERDGEYTFALVSDDGSQMYFGEVDRFQADQMQGSAGPTPWAAELANDGLARGEVVSIDADQLTMKLPLGDEQSAEVAIGLGHVRSLWDATVDRQSVDTSAQADGEDTAYIRDREDPTAIRSVSGRITALDDTSLTFVYRGQERKVDVARVAGMVFNHVDRPAPPHPGFHQTLRLRTGQELPVRLLSLGERAEVELIGGGRIDLPREAVIMLRTRDGRVGDLTRIAPTAEEAIPFFSFTIPHRVNRAFDGTPLRIFGDKEYDTGLAVHAKSRLHYRLDRPCQRFTAIFGLLEPGGKLGDVTARVLGDGEVLWEQEHITAQTGPVAVDVDISGVQRLVLEVDFGGGQDVGDRAAWCNPKLIRESSE